MKKILCIDGGGIKGAFPAAFLSELQEQIEQPLNQYFDLIAGTSTGGIIAIGLGLGFSPKQILEFYESEGPQIFSQTKMGIYGKFINKVKDFKRFAIGAKHDNETLDNALTKIFGERKFGESQNRLFIPSFHRTNLRLHIFKTAHHERFRTDYKVLAKDVAVATSSAPTYFKEHVTQDGLGLIDGGIWANNPTGFAIAEALGNLGWKPEEIKVLSIGCLSETFTLKPSYSAIGIARPLVDIFMAGQSESSKGISETLLGQVGGSGNKAIYRIDMSVPKNYFTLDDTSKINELISKGVGEARTAFPDLKEVFFQNTVDKFEPIYKVN